MGKNKIKESIFFSIIATIILIYSLVNHYTTRGLKWGLSPYLFPLLVSIFMVLISATLFAEGLRDKKSMKEEMREEANWKGILFTIIISILYFFAMNLLGFIISSIIFLAIMFVHLGERRKWLIAIISVTTPVLIYFVFGVLLHVMVP